MVGRTYLLFVWLGLSLLVSPPAAASPEALAMAYVQAYRAADVEQLHALFLPVAGAPSRLDLRHQLRDYELRGYRVKPLLSRDRQAVKAPDGVQLAKRFQLNFHALRGGREQLLDYLIVHYRGRWLLWAGGVE